MGRGVSVSVRTAPGSSSESAAALAAVALAVSASPAGDSGGAPGDAQAATSRRESRCAAVEIVDIGRERGLAW